MNGNRRGIGRTEVIVTIVILVIGFAVLLPGLLVMREAARQNTCKFNLHKRIHVALANYQETHQAYPYGCVGNPDLPPEKRWSWYVGLHPFLEQPAGPLPLNTMLDSSQFEKEPRTFDTFDKEGNAIKIEFPNLGPLLCCPNGLDDVDGLKHPLTTYVGMAGSGRDAPTLPQQHPRAGMWGYNRQTVLDKKFKGREYTISVIETNRNRGSWYRGGEATVRPFVPSGEDNSSRPPIGSDGQFGGLHSDGANVLFADGSVRMQSKTIDAEVFKRLTTLQQEATP
ncbi:MAG: hypothetical protein Tsb009_01770 [Planctomycetaceae bacterium]